MRFVRWQRYGYMGRSSLNLDAKYPSGPPVRIPQPRGTMPRSAR
ncbi:hypothetical protein CLIM01_00081 [Colletotrichum limetticola]|uniref:Uncharacterized protein n=1 Tax=Colletotrichum limetticola TaxID=1209924 RepID=A0ABQ9QG46_9PEZI|nr:hypothetical protein CLIM01_00081 [Colletotrichum limetticola]